VCHILKYDLLNGALSQDAFYVWVSIAQKLLSKCNGAKKRNRKRISDHIRMRRRQPVWHRQMSSESKMIKAVNRIYIYIYIYIYICSFTV